MSNCNGHIYIYTHVLHTFQRGCHVSNGREQHLRYAPISPRPLETCLSSNRHAPSVKPAMPSPVEHNCYSIATRGCHVSDGREQHLRYAPISPRPLETCLSSNRHAPSVKPAMPSPVAATTMLRTVPPPRTQEIQRGRHTPPTRPPTPSSLSPPTRPSPNKQRQTGSPFLMDVSTYIDYYAPFFAPRTSFQRAIPDSAH